MQGELVARVPESAVGFTVRTDSVNVVDLGTAFGMNAEASGDVEVQVFQGEVELVSPQNSPGALAKPKRVRTGQGFRAKMTNQGSKGGAAKKKVVLEAATSDGTKYQRINSFNSGVVKTSGPVRFVAVEPGQRLAHYESNKTLFVFRERAGMWLEEPIEVDVTEPGNYGQAERTVETGSGFAVRSYLLHFNPVGRLENEGKNGRPVVAAITFDQRVEGIILGNERLRETGTVFTRDAAKYVTGQAIDPQVQGKPEKDFKGRFLGDRVILSPDRKTVRVNWKASTGMDQIRVLVRDE